MHNIHDSFHYCIFHPVCFSYIMWCFICIMVHASRIQLCHPFEQCTTIWCCKLGWLGSLRPGVNPIVHWTGGNMQHLTNNLRHQYSPLCCSSYKMTIIRFWNKCFSPIWSPITFLEIYNVLMVIGKTCGEEKHMSTKHTHQQTHKMFLWCWVLIFYYLQCKALSLVPFMIMYVSWFGMADLGCANVLVRLCYVMR